MGKLISLTVMVGVALGWGMFGWVNFNQTKLTQPKVESPVRGVTKLLIPTPTLVPIKSVILEVPFTAQAPFGEWSDNRQQDGCEEASVLMAYCATHKEACVMGGGKIEPNWAKQKILDIYEFEVKKWGNGIDTSVEDSYARIASEYFKVKKAQVKSIGSIEMIIRELMEGKVVVVPANGKKLGNPNFTNGGPERHNLVISGYDLETREFIAQDPGTRQGRNYRYKEEALFEALRDYPTGDHVPIVGVEKKMIIFERETI